MSEPDPELEKLKAARFYAENELEKIRLDAAKVVAALDAAIQLTEALIEWMPEGMVLSERVTLAKRRLDQAIKDMRS